MHNILGTYKWNVEHRAVTEVSITAIEKVRIGDKLFSKSITQSGYDLEIPVTHNYFANNILVSNSEDENLLEMFRNKHDSHGSTAVNMFGLDCTPDECKKKYPVQRQVGKVLNFLKTKAVA